MDNRNNTLVTSYEFRLYSEIGEKTIEFFHNKKTVKKRFFAKEVVDYQEVRDARCMRQVEIAILIDTLGEDEKKITRVSVKNLDTFLTHSYHFEGLDDYVLIFVDGELTIKIEANGTVDSLVSSLAAQIEENMAQIEANKNLRKDY